MLLSSAFKINLRRYIEDEKEVFSDFTSSSFFSPYGLEATAPVFGSSDYLQLPSPLGRARQISFAPPPPPLSAPPPPPPPPPPPERAVRHVIQRNM